MDLEISEWAGIGIVFMLLWVIPAYFVARVAAGNKKSFAKYLITSLLIGWLIPLIPALANRGEDSVQSKKCIYCAGLLRSEATICVHCGKELDFVSLT